jgi:ectoine hydroxylase-related dioxygenase (phytanoyl-CoA dioxygenase family)
MEPTLSLTQQQIDSYHANGFLALDAITTPDEVEWMRGIYDRLFAQRAGRDEGNQFDLGGSDEEGKTAVLPQILQPSKYAPELKEGLFRVNGLHVARQLLGEKAEPMGEHAIFKPARYGAETPWHQDEAYWGEQMLYNSFSMWIPLQPATIENGCMQFIPASHKSEIQPHHSIGHDVRVHGLEMDQLPEPSRAVACPIPAGGCTIHHNRMMHYAGANRSDIPRRALILGFGTKPTPYPGEPRDFYWNKLKQTARAAREERAKASTPQG